MKNGQTPTSLEFKYWPFDLVPSPGQSLIWADRATLKEQILRLGRRLGRHEAVSLHLLWADFGAGKTHALLYLKQEAEKGVFGAVLPLYCALPKGCKAFTDIYRAMVRAIPIGLLARAYQQAVTSLGRDNVDTQLANVWASLARCFQTIAIGSELQRQTALGWLCAEPGVSARELQGLSILGRIKSTDEAVLALCGITRLFNLAGHKRVLLMVDEFQRVETLRRQQQDEINAGLHGFFNACGRGVSLLLSFSFGVEENIRHFLNPELLSRVDPLRISIPRLSASEGSTFLDDVIRLAREPSAPWAVAADIVPAIVSAVAANHDLTPRRLMKAAGLAFELASMDLEDGKISKLAPEYIRQMVARGEFSRLDELEEQD